MIVLTFILFFAFGLVLIWFWTRKKDSPGELNAPKFSFPLNTLSSSFGTMGMQTRIVFNGKEYSSTEEMRDTGLITEQEYETKKTEILNRM
jgi:hypothetical protein